MKIGIVGLGLIGASFGRTLLKRTDHEVYGYDVDSVIIEEARFIYAIHKPLTEENVRDIDLLVFAVFAGDFKEVAETYLPNMKDGATVMDFCGNKRSIAADMLELSQVYPKINFIGGHPMSGREVAGIENSKDDLFDGASMVFTPINVGLDKVVFWKEFFISLGFGDVVVTTPENHDKNIAYTSQLCHIVSNAYIKSPTAKNHFGYSAGSYRDLTRVARLNPGMWTELMIGNADNLIAELDLLIENLQKYSDALKREDEITLYRLLQEGDSIKLKIDKGKIE